MLQIIQRVIVIVRLIAEIAITIWLPNCGQSSQRVRLVAPLVTGLVGDGGCRELRIIGADGAAVGVSDPRHAAKGVIDEAVARRGRRIGWTMVGAGLPSLHLIRIALVHLLSQPVIARIHVIYDIWAGLTIQLGGADNSA